MRKALASALVLGLLATGGAASATVLFVLDASGSMWGQIDGRHKIEIARDVLGDLVQDLPEDIDVGLEVYGHNRKGDCKDIEVIVAPGADRAAILAAVKNLNPMGKTPLTESIRVAAAQLQQTEGSASIVVVSDGQETCEGDPCAAAAEARKSGVDVRIHVVGFDVTDEEAAQLKCIAENGGGNYYGASNAAEMVTAFAQVKEEVVAAPPPPPPPAEPTVYFIDNFDGSDLGPHWLVTRPNPENYLVENGELLAISSVAADWGAQENLFQLDKALPPGDWTATARIRADFQSQWSLPYFGLIDENGEGLFVRLMATAGGCLSGASYHVHLNATPYKRSGTEQAGAGKEVHRIPRCDDVEKSLGAWFAPVQPLLVQLRKTGRSYTFAVKLEGIKEPQWVVTEPFSLLRAKGNVAMGTYKNYRDAPGEATLTVDWVKIEVME